MARRWYVLRVLPGRAGRVRLSIREAIIGAGFSELVDQVAMPSKPHRFRRYDFGSGRLTWRKHLPGYLFLRVLSEEWPDGLLDVLGGVRGIGAIDSRADVPQPVPEEIAAKLDAGRWTYQHGHLAPGVAEREHRRRLVLKYGPGRFRNR